MNTTRTSYPIHVYTSSGPLQRAAKHNPNAIVVSSTHKRRVKLLGLNGKAPGYENIRHAGAVPYLDAVNLIRKQCQQ